MSRGAIPTRRSTYLAHVGTSQLGGLRLPMCIRYWAGDLASAKGKEDNGRGAHRRLHPVLVKRRHSLAFCILHSVLRENPSLKIRNRIMCRESHGMHGISVHCHNYKLKPTTLALRSHEPGSMANCDAEPLM